MRKTPLIPAIPALLLSIAGCTGGAQAPDERPIARLVARLRAEGRAAPDETPEAAAARVAAANVALLRSAAPGVDVLAKRVAESGRGIAAPRKTDYLTPAEAEELRLIACSYLQLTKPLARVTDDHEGFAAMPELAPRDRYLGIAARLAAGLLQQDLSRAVVAAFEPSRLARDQLDRPLEKDHVPPRLFRRIRDASSLLRARAALREAIDRFQAADVQRVILEDKEDGDLRWLAKRIYSSPSYDELRKDEELTRIVARGPQKVEAAAIGVADLADRAVYPAQVFVSTIVGDAVTSGRAPRIAHDAAERTRREVVRPGDVLLERCDFYVSNAFLPGWWGHAALYVGDAADMRRLGLGDDPAVKPHLDELARDHDLVEAVSEGVVVSSLEHLMRADHIAVLRPHYANDDALRRSVRTAFANVGKAYDFRFDFESDDVLVCSELCWRSLDGVIQVPLVKRFGHFTLTPDEFAALALGPKPQLELVEFLKDGKQATRADFEAILK